MRNARKVFYLVLIITIAVPIAATTIQHGVYLRWSSNDAHAIADLRMKLLQQSIATWMSEQAKVVYFLAADIENMPYDVDENHIFKVSSSLLAKSPSLSSLYYGTSDNRMINASGWKPPPGFDLRLRPWYQKAIDESRLVYTQPFLNASQDAMIVTVAKPVYGVLGELWGVVGADIGLSTIITMIEGARITPNSATYLLSGDDMIASTKKDDHDEVPDEEIFLTWLRDHKSSPHWNVPEVFGRHQVLYSPIEGTEWRLAVFVPWNDFFPHARALWLSFFLIALSAGVLAGGFVVFYQLQITNPLASLEQAITSLDVTDNYSDRIPETDSAGFLPLVESMNELLDRAQSYSEELTASKVELELSQTYWRALFDNALDAIVMVDRADRIANVNHSFERLFEYKFSEIEGQNLDLLITSHKYEEAVTLTNMKTTGEAVNIETTRISRSGREIDVEIKAIPIMISGSVVGGYVIYTDISKRMENEREILLLSQHDQLTGLYNRSFFDTSMRELDHDGVIPLSLVMGDTNGLKVINDAFGHAVGDDLLRRTAQVIRRCCGPQDIPARIGGDEFAILMPGASQNEAEELCRCIERTCKEQSEGMMQLSIALGSGTKLSPDDKLSLLFGTAEDRMYRRKLREGKSIRNSLIASLLQAFQEKTRETSAHSGRMEELSRQLAERVGLTGAALDDIYLLASLHDIGKIGIPDHILNKPGALTPEEWETMKKHSEIGYRIASATVELAHIAECILYHHERWDGTGYPQGLATEDIPLASRIIAVVDAYDAMTNHRSYRQALSHEKAMDEIRKGTGSHFDPHIAEALIQLVSAQES